jgi:xanthine dehydrogenase accessory factor
VITGQISQRADELSARGEAFVAATVVHVEKPTSVQPGNVALVHEDGTIEGFVGGVCAQHSVRLYSLRAIERGEPLLLRILGETSDEPTEELEPTAGTEVHSDEGAVTVQNPCLSGGSIEVFLEPFLPAPRVVVAGESPIARAIERLGPELGLEVVAARDEANRRRDPLPSDLALVVAAHGRDEVEILQAGVEAGVEYVGLVASHKRGAAVIDELRAADVSARSPAEIALSILARIIAVRRLGDPSARTPAHPHASVTTATDPICGMTVVVGAETPSVEHAGETVYFCCEGCKRSFQAA